MIAIGQSVDPLQLLGFLAFNHLARAEPTNGDSEKAEVHETPVEFILSLWLGSPFPASPLDRTPEATVECVELLDHVYQLASTYYAMTSRSVGTNPAERELLVSLRMDTLHIRGEGYREHIELHYRAIAAPHDAMLHTGYGFDSAQLADAISYIERSVQSNLDAANEARLASRLAMFQAAAHDLNLPAEDSAVRHYAMSPEFAERHRTEIEASLFDFNRLSSPEVFALVPRNQTDALIFAQLALHFGDNAQFVHGIPRWRGWPLNPTKIRERPLILHAGRYYAFHLPLLGRNALRIVEDLLRRLNPNYWQNTFLPRRDTWIESTAVDLVAGMLPGRTVHKNLFYDCVDDGRPVHTEVDGLVVYDDCLLIIEVKASTFGDDARRGAPDAIADGLRDSIDRAYVQARRVLDLVRSTEEVRFTDEGGTERLRVRFREFRHFFLISVTRENLGSYATRLSLTRNLGFIQPGAEWPWAVSLLDLRVISEITTRPSMFLHYLVRRLAANEVPTLAASDEIDLFGFFLAGQLFFEANDDRQGTHIVPHGFCEPIDAFFEARRNGLTLPRPALELPTRFSALLAMLEQARPRHFATACMDLLQYNGQLYAQMDENISRIEAALTQRNVCAQITLGNNEGSMIPTLVLACCRLDSLQEVQALGQIRVNKQRRFPHNRATVILWQPPMANNRCRVHLLQ